MISINTFPPFNAMNLIKISVDKTKIENSVNIDPELDSSRLNIPKECPNGFKRIFSNKGDRDLCHAFFLNPSIHPKTWQEVKNLNDFHD